METKQLILLGLPGVGMKDQAAVLAERWGVPHVSMADLLRAAIAGTPGTEARSSEAAGESVPDALAMQLIRRRFEQPDVMLKGWVLEGFPRHLAEAQAFTDWWARFGQTAFSVVYLKAMTGLLISRLAAEGQEQPVSAIRRQIERHQEALDPLLDYYRQRSQLTTINGSLSFAEVARELAQLGQTDAGAAGWIQDEAELNARIAQDSRLVVDCTASWCGSCKQVAPLIDQLAVAYGDHLTVMKIDFDSNRQISQRFGLKGLPAVLFFKDGERTETLTGVKSYPEYTAAAARLLG